MPGAFAEPLQVLGRVDVDAEALVVGVEPGDPFRVVEAPAAKALQERVLVGIPLVQVDLGLGVGRWGGPIRWATRRIESFS